ncbi:MULTISPECIES: hypothetical protein [Bacillus cereus group]|uniref:hypothetical protein n=1 Tax=Bacillus cereus group TaxID=86661 RepID=UPI00128CE585|nr:MULTISPECIES: hypothetical protein [Bacillus cereus group]MDA1625952.1 hypothetical protein [Bacillus cereus group sp. TH206-1LC]MDA1899053.1 hypothetical protein [Bacillus cereus group sp. BcHK28]NUJ09846.1 hypothetical protein [Bacillus paranthracis]HDR7898753.1 hypothetical protein [Bacillus pacificus]
MVACLKINEIGEYISTKDKTLEIINPINRFLNAKPITVTNIPTIKKHKTKNIKFTTNQTKVLTEKKLSDNPIITAEIPKLNIKLIKTNRIEKNNIFSIIIFCNFSRLEKRITLKICNSFKYISEEENKKRNKIYVGNTGKEKE